MSLNQNIANDAIMDGAFGFLDRLQAQTQVYNDWIDMLERQYGGQGGFGRDEAIYVADLYDDSRRAGRAINARRGDTTADTALLPRVPGCRDNFQYTVVFRIRSNTTGQERTYPVNVNHDVPLGKLSILHSAEEALNRDIAANRVGSPRPGERLEWEQIGQGRVTAAANCG